MVCQAHPIFPLFLPQSYCGRTVERIKKTATLTDRGSYSVVIQLCVGLQRALMRCRTLSNLRCHLWLWHAQINVIGVSPFEQCAPAIRGRVFQVVL